VALLMLFALLAGAGTALSPCVLPVLPAVLGAGVTGGRRRPLGVVTGLVLAFTFATVALVYVIDALGLPDDFVRTLAIATLLAFGIALLIPSLADRIEALGSRLAPAPVRVAGEGFGSGLVLGASLGFVYTPCAGPILAGVVTVSAAQDFTAGKLAVASAYAIGSGAVLYALMLGGRRVADRRRPYQSWVQAGTGAVMVAVAVAMTADLDLEFQNAIADDLPAFLVNPTGDLEESEAVAEDLAAVRGGHGAEEGGAAEAEEGIELPDYGAAPDFTNTQEWFNTPRGKPLEIADLTERGRVVLIDFWTYTCINCIRTLPYLRAWDDDYRRDGLTIVGVHSPEFSFEKDAGNVSDAIGEYGIRYPVVQDNELGTWSAFANQYWPAKYLIDSRGHLRYAHFGEGAYETTELAIRSLLAEAGDAELGPTAEATAETIDPDLRTPETYLGYERGQGWVEGPNPGASTYDAPDPGDLDPNQFAFGGDWRVNTESATALADGTISLRFQARRVFLVMGSPGRPRTLRVELDGEPISDRFAGQDVSGGSTTISNQRLYRLVDLPDAGDHTLTLRFEPGIAGYAFTFG
jgi:cytochrome c biogenesis protein CcdA/thiol-disulfide isomerase/thioredoxin